jgi:PIN domain nuclease of toxin-antitoxin system
MSRKHADPRAGRGDFVKIEHLPRRHRDPFDRLLVAQAELEDHALVSADPRLAEYGVEVVW